MTLNFDFGLLNIAGAGAEIRCNPTDNTVLQCLLTDAVMCEVCAGVFVPRSRSI